MMVRVRHKIEHRTGALEAIYTRGLLLLITMTYHNKSGIPALSYSTHGYTDLAGDVHIGH